MSSILAETSNSIYEINLGEPPKPIDNNYKISVARMYKTGEAMLIIYDTVTTKVKYMIVHEKETVLLDNEWVVETIYDTTEEASARPKIVELRQVV